MENTKIVIDSSSVEHIVIEREDGSFLSMPKAVYDKQQANQAKGTIS